MKTLRLAIIARGVCQGLASATEVVALRTDPASGASERVAAVSGNDVFSAPVSGKSGDGQRSPALAYLGGIRDFPEFADLSVGARVLLASGQCKDPTTVQPVAIYPSAATLASLGPALADAAEPAAATPNAKEALLARFDNAIADLALLVPTRARSFAERLAALEADTAACERGWLGGPLDEVAGVCQPPTSAADEMQGWYLDAFLLCLQGRSGQLSQRGRFMHRAASQIRTDSLRAATSIRFDDTPEEDEDALSLPAVVARRAAVVSACERIVAVYALKTVPHYEYEQGVVDHCGFLHGTQGYSEEETWRALVVLGHEVSRLTRERVHRVDQLSTLLATYWVPVIGKHFPELKKLTAAASAAAFADDVTLWERFFFAKRNSLGIHTTTRAVSVSSRQAVFAFVARHGRPGYLAYLVGALNHWGKQHASAALSADLLLQVFSEPLRCDSQAACADLVTNILVEANGLLEMKWGTFMQKSKNAVTLRATVRVIDTLISGVMHDTDFRFVRLEVPASARPQEAVSLLAATLGVSPAALPSSTTGPVVSLSRAAELCRWKERFEEIDISATATGVAAVVAVWEHLEEGAPITPHVGTPADLAVLIDRLQPLRVVMGGETRTLQRTSFDALQARLQANAAFCEARFTVAGAEVPAPVCAVVSPAGHAPVGSARLRSYIECLEEKAFLLAPVEQGHLRALLEVDRLWITTRTDTHGDECELVMAVYAVIVANDPFAALDPMVDWCAYLRGSANLPLDATLDGLVVLSNKVARLTRFGHRRSDEYMRVLAEYWVSLLGVFYPVRVAPLLRMAKAHIDRQNALYGARLSTADLLVATLRTAALPSARRADGEALWSFVLENGHEGTIALVVALLALNNERIAAIPRGTRTDELEKQAYEAVIAPYSLLHDLTSADIAAQAAVTRRSRVTVGTQAISVDDMVRIIDALVDDLMVRNQYVTVLRVD